MKPARRAAFLPGKIRDSVAIQPRPAHFPHIDGSRFFARRCLQISTSLDQRLGRIMRAVVFSLW